MERIAWRIILGMFVVDSILGLYLGVHFSRFIFSADGFSYAEAATLEVKIGPAAEQLIQELKEIGLDPTLRQKITRAPFSVSGRIITLSGDNIQIFEYPDQDLAQKEAPLLASKYVDGQRPSRWKDSVHLYTQDVLTVFYLGNNEDIIKALERSAGPSLLEKPL